MTSTASFSERIESLRQALRSADNIAGSGLTTAAGLDYAGDDFRSVFAPWIERYGFTDLYTSSFYPFESREEYWAYWAEHIWFCRYRSGALPLYRVLKETLSAISPHRPTFIVTTNVDAQFELAGFPTDNIFATQGDYCFFQPASGSPKILINNKEWIMKVLPHIKDLVTPGEGAEKYKHLRFAIEKPIASSNYTIRYADIDINRHLYSMRYIELAMDMVDLETHQSKTIVSADVNYISEVLYNQQVTLIINQEGDSSQIEMLNADQKPMFRAEFVWKDK